MRSNLIFDFFIKQNSHKNLSFVRQFYLQLFQFDSYNLLFLFFFSFLLKKAFKDTKKNLYRISSKRFLVKAIRHY